MKNYLNLFFINLLFVICLNSCSNDVQDISINQTKNCYILDIDNNDDISENDVKSVISNLNSNRISKSNNTIKEIKEILTISNDLNKPLIYIVNYSDNNGFSIISATKRYYPIIAEINQGNYDPRNIEPAFEEWINTTKNIINTLCDYPETNSDVISYRKQWLEFNKTKKYFATKSSQVIDLVSGSIVEWERQGYNVIMLRDFLNSSSFSQELKDEVNNVTYIYANHQYDRMMYAFILTKEVMTTEKVSPLTTSQWDQSNGFNSMLDKINNQLPLLGCVGVATAQIMKYHRFPTHFNWAAMNDYSSNDVTASFLKDVAISVNTNFGITASSSNIENAKNALINSYKYSSDMKIVSHSKYTALESIKKYGPIYMRGESSQNEGHAWVCDGFTYTYGNTEIIVKGLEDCPPGYIPVRYNSILQKNEDPFNTIYFSMNWGWGGVFNGMYYEGSFPSQDHAYSKNRKNIINIHH